MARMVVEDYGVQTYGDAILPLLEAQRKMETNAWKLAGGVLKPSQVNGIEGFDQRVAGEKSQPALRRARSVSANLWPPWAGRRPQATTAPTSIFSLLYLDPLAGLDPTAAAIEETRELGERAMYYTQRMPTLVELAGGGAGVSTRRPAGIAAGVERRQPARRRRRKFLPRPRSNCPNSSTTSARPPSSSFLTA